MQSSTLIIGVGNTLRSDDGAGAYVCDAIDRLKIENVFTQKVQQLQTEIIETMLLYDKVIVVDAALNIDDIIIQKLDNENLSANASSHHTDIGLIKALAKKLYKQDINLFTCAIPAVCFDIKEEVSASTKYYADKAVTVIKNLLT